MTQRRPIVAMPEDEPHPATLVTIHIRRPDGLDLELSGEAAFVERVLVAVGVLPATASAAPAA